MGFEGVQKRNGETQKIKPEKADACSAQGCYDGYHMSGCWQDAARVMRAILRITTRNKYMCKHNRSMANNDLFGRQQE